MLRLTRILRAEAAPAAATRHDGPSKLLFKFASPTNVYLNNSVVYSVNVPGVEGDFSIMADHAPIIAQLRPGTVQVQETAASEERQNYFITGGFAVVHPDSTASITAAEVIPLAELDFDMAKRALEEQRANLAKAATDDERAAASIGVEVYEAIVGADSFKK